MSIIERNRRNVISRWKKQHEKELERIKSKKNVNFLKARICGFLVGDGSVYIRKEKQSGKVHHEIKFFPDHESLIKPFIYAFKEAYNKTPKVIKKNNYYVIRINSKIVILNLLSLCSFSSEGWTIPSFKEVECKKEWLRAMFDSDSYVGNEYVRLKTINKKGLEHVKKLLLEFKIKTSRIYVYKPRNEKWKTNYMLDIRDKKSLKIFLKDIGFNHKLKKEKLLSLIKKYDMPR
ncbi:MAG: LAGLIDADG family homing endonuclease [Candidatus Aenigmatarchaeota archaeon]